MSDFLVEVGDSPISAPPKRPLMVSFSGVDGSGKSTQIENLKQAMNAAGLKVVQFAFWDDVVVGCRYRENFVHKVYGSEPGVGAPGKPVERRDKNVRAAYLTLARHGLYLADAVHLAWLVDRAFNSDADVIIFDRYIYDEWANLPLEKSLTRGYITWVRTFIPEPDIAFLLDADPEAARERKPEYPVEFMRECRESYARLAEFLKNLTVVPPLPLEEAKARVVNEWKRRMTPAAEPDEQLAPVRQSAA